MRIINVRALFYACLLAGLTGGFARLAEVERSAAAARQPMPVLQGAAAAQYLKEQGQFEALTAAVQAAQPASPANLAEQQKVGGGDGAADDNFGEAVALSGDTAVVGAKFDNVNSNVNQGSAYVFVRSGTSWVQQQQLTASDGAASDLCGGSVAVSGDTVVVGADAHDTGGNANQGAAYVFVRNGTNWTQQQKLTAGDGEASDHFGNSVAVNGGTVAVGALNDDIGANLLQGSSYIFVRNGTVWSEQQRLTAADGAQADHFGNAVAVNGDTAVIAASQDIVGGQAFQGSAYVFVRNGVTWTQQQKLTASDGAADDLFGVSVALSGDLALIGALEDDSGALTNHGSAYLFVRNGAAWTELQKLTASDGALNDRFGRSVALSADMAVVGSALDDSGANTNQGAAYVFMRSGTNWTEQQKLTASDGAAGDEFGRSVALSGGTVVAGAYRDDVGAQADQGSAYFFAPLATTLTLQQKLLAADATNDDGLGGAMALSGDTVVVGAPFDTAGIGPAVGSAYVFVRSGTTWTQQQKLTAGDLGLDDHFGSTVAINGNTVIIGSPTDDVGATGNQGSAYVFVRSGATWTQQQKLTAGDGAANDGFGSAVALSGQTALVGAGGDDVGANSDQGAAYVFVRSGTAWTEQQKLTATDGADGDNLGRAVALDGNTALVGAEFDDVGTNIIQGSAYVFVRSGTTWTQQQRLTASDGATGDGLGAAVALSGDTALAGAPFDDVGGIVNRGSAYVFVRLGTIWTQQQRLSAGDGAAHDNFGNDVALFGERALVGAHFDDTGTNTEQGSAYLFTRTGTAWTQAQKLTAFDGARDDAFGAVVTLDGTTAIAGAPGDDAAFGNQGSLYVFIGQPACSFSIAPTGQSFPVGGGSGLVNVTTAAGCEWTAASNAGFITITSGASGNGNGTVNYSVAANAGPQRTGTLAIAGQTFTVTQDSGCAFTINPTSQNFAAAGGAGSVMLTASDANCAWMAASNDLWLSVTNASGTGSGALGFTVQANTGAARIGTLTIAGQTFTVNQAAGSSGLMFYPLPRPLRLLDTRPDQSLCDNVGTPITGGTALTTPARITCNGLTIPANAQAIVGNVTVINQTASFGFLTLFPAGQTLPLAANIIYEPGQLLSNNFTVGLNANGEFSTFAERTLHTVIDVSGYFAPPTPTGLFYHALPRPLRLLDTRPDQSLCDNVGLPITGGSALTTQARISCNGLTIPNSAQAIVGNATVINQTASFGFMTLFPSGQTLPLAANMIYAPNQLLANAFTVGLSAGGAFDTFAERTLHLVIDVAGYYSTEANDANGPGLLFNPLPRPLRLLDTRADQSLCDNIGAPIAAGTSLTTQARITCNGITIPTAAQAVNGNITVINQTALFGFMTLFPAGQTLPLAANLIYAPGQLLSNAFVVGLSGLGEFNTFGERTIHVVIDVSGYFAP